LVRSGAPIGRFNPRRLGIWPKFYHRQASSHEELARKQWPDDPVTPIILKSATAPATMLTTGWAAELAVTSVADLLTTLGPQSAAGELFSQTSMLSFRMASGISVPGLEVSASDSQFVGEGLPIPVRQLDVGSVTLVPRKFAGICVATSELLGASDAERLLRSALIESVGAALDAALFDATAASTTRPAGLRNGVTVTTATSGGGDAAMMKDLGALAQAVSAVGGTQIAFIAAPGEAVKILLRAGPNFRFPVFASSGLAAGYVLCVALPALAVAVDPIPAIEASRDAIMQMEDTSPVAIGTTGSPNVVGAPIRSMYQTDSVSLRVIMRVGWAVRAAGAIAWTQSVTW
jgi:hypothetical protein